MNGPPPPNPWGDRRRRRVGLLGGSFNPAHAGHRHISLLALTRLRLDEVWWMVSPQNPLKPVVGMAPFARRVDLAIRVARHPRIRVTGIEATLGTRFTADTVSVLRRRFPRVRFVWLMGDDNLLQIPRWERWLSIFRSVPVAVFARGSYSLKVLSGLAARRFSHCRAQPRAAGTIAERVPPAWVYLPLRRHAASATEIRRRMAAEDERSTPFNG
ncbi:MAG: nicotinate-nucleotide adenylyltransferase [Alphaproteobacteria bacterium]|nr:nicotinate-nucleotide adenylyltransferase [Alphaproteobacteria bacterium]